MSSYKDWIDKIDIDIDYYSAFIKAWIAFNSWYRGESDYKGLTDRKALDKIEEESNIFKNAIISLLGANTGGKSERFEENLMKLHKALSESTITTQENRHTTKQISLAEIAVKNSHRIEELNYSRIHYKIDFQQNEKLIITLSKVGNSSIEYFKFEQTKYDLLELISLPEYKRLSNTQQGQCAAAYKRVEPYIFESILQKDSNNDDVFIDNYEMVSRGIIEVLYLLRCSLMHGELYPTEAALKVYQYAYNVLSMILNKMR